jgi:hypothetical protein
MILDKSYLGLLRFMTSSSFLVVLSLVSRWQGPGVSAPLQRNGAVRGFSGRPGGWVGALVAARRARAHYREKNEQKPEELRHGKHVQKLTNEVSMRNTTMSICLANSCFSLT